MKLTKILKLAFIPLVLIPLVGGAIAVSEIKEIKDKVVEENILSEKTKVYNNNLKDKDHEITPQDIFRAPQGG